MTTIPDSHRDLLSAQAGTLATIGPVSFLILDPANPYRYLEIRGDAEITPDDDYVFADKVGAKYGSDLRAHDQPGQSRVVVTIRPVRVNAVNMGG